MKHPVSRRYATAFLSIGVERGNHRTLQKQLREFADAFTKSDDLRLALSNPSIKIAERRDVVRAVGKRAFWDAMTVNFLLLLLDRDRIIHVADIAYEMDALVDVHDGNIRAHITSAKPLKDTQVANIKGAIARMTGGKNVLLETATDGALLGGIVTRIGDTVYDGSVRTQLATLRESILEEV